VRDLATNPKIELVFIPPDCTHLLQQLDCLVIGVLKAKARFDWRSRYHSRRGGKNTRTELIADLVESANGITESVTASAWSVDGDEQGRSHDGEFTKSNALDIRMSTRELFADRTERMF
jgi:hypothetical protein